MNREGYKADNWVNGNGEKVDLENLEDGSYITLKWKEA